MVYRPEACLGPLPHGPLQRTCHHMAAGFITVERRARERGLTVTGVCNLIMEATSHRFCHVLLVKAPRSRGPSRGGGDKGHENQEVGITASRVRVCPPHRPSAIFKIISHVPTYPFFNPPVAAPCDYTLVRNRRCTNPRTNPDVSKRWAWAVMMRRRGSGCTRC